MVGVEVLQRSSEEACQKKVGSGAELLAQEDLVQSDECELHQRQKIPLVRKPLTDANKNLVVVIARNDDWRRWRYEILTIFHDAEQPVLLNFPDKLGSGKVACGRQRELMGEKEAAVDGDNQAAKNGESPSGRRRFFGHL